jgi:16S rRNA pseudouridine516 synthase
MNGSLSFATGFQAKRRRSSPDMGRNIRFLALSRKPMQRSALERRYGRPVSKTSPVKRLRLDRVLANLGYASRSEAKQLIDTGRVMVSTPVSSEVITNPSHLVDPHKVLLDGHPLDRPDGILVILHKPVGYVCTHDFEEGLRAYDLLPTLWEYRNPQVVSIGRLDKDSSGLLMLTDNHQLVHRLTSPKHHVQKRYAVELDQRCTDEVVERFASGTIVLHGDTKPCLPAEVIIGPDNTAEVVLIEGRFRQLRRMFASCKREVLSLHRTHFGPWSLNDLPEGQWVDAEV